MKILDKFFAYFLEFFCSKANEAMKPNLTGTILDSVDSFSQSFKKQGGVAEKKYKGMAEVYVDQYAFRPKK